MAVELAHGAADEANANGKRARGRGAVLVALVVFLLAAALFVARAAPGVTFEDSGELAAAAASGGVAHPPGYPFLMLVGRAWIELTSFATGDAARSLNLFSALCAAGAAALLTLTLARLGAATGIALGTGALAVLSTTFAAQAVVTEVYAPAALLQAALICVALTARKPAVPAAFLLGLACTAHQASALYLPLVLAAAWRQRGAGLLSGRTLGLAALAFALGLSLYLYVPLAAAGDPAVNWGEVKSLAAFEDHILRVQYRTDTEQALGPKFAFQFEQSLGQWTGAVAIGVAGLFALGRAKRLTFERYALAATFACAALGLWLAVDFPLSEPSTRARLAGSYLPLVLLLAALAGLGFHGLVGLSRRPRSGWALGALMVAVAGTSRPETLAGTLDQSDATYAEDYAREVLAACPPDAILLIGKRGYSDILYFPLLYMQLEHGLRPDVLLLERESLELAWRRKQFAARHPELAPGLAKLDALFDAADADALPARERRMLSVPFLQEVFAGARPVVSIHHPGERVLGPNALVAGPVLWHVVRPGAAPPAPSTAPPAVTWLPALDVDPWTAEVRGLARERDEARAAALEQVGELDAAEALRRRWSEGAR